MEYVATFDIGTTAIKGVLVSHDWQVAATQSVEVTTLFEEDRKEQDPRQWYEGVCAIARYFAGQVPQESITSVVMSGQMQDLILLDEGGMPVGNAILYSDNRAAGQAAEIAKAIGASVIELATGNQFNGSIPFAKLLWLKQNAPGQLQQAHKMVFSSKDAVITRLTGSFVSDVTTSSTTGLMDIATGTWHSGWLQTCGLSPSLLPTLLYAEELAGRITQQAAAECGLAAGTPVYAGTGDAGATTLASGITQIGQFNINLGTSGWVATVSNATMQKEGVFNLAAMPKNMVVNVVPFFNAGNVHKWACGIVAPEEGANKYAYGDQLLAQSVAGSNGTLCLPYLVGERFPVVDSAIRGAFVGLTPETSKSDLLRAALEGVAFSIRQGIESLQTAPTSISVIGGGAQTPVWCQILADVLGHPLQVYQNAEFAPAFAIAAAAQVAFGAMQGYSGVTGILQGASTCQTYTPDPENMAIYQDVYARYLRLYPALQTI